MPPPWITAPPPHWSNCSKRKWIGLPNAEAVRFENTSWSYAELDERANRIANRLVREGTQPDAVVAVCMERSADRVAALYGVLKSGAAYLPLEADLPADRIAQILDEAAPVAVLCSESTQSQLDEIWPTVLISATSSESPERLSLTHDPGSLAYVIYTSGSTGRPKGVMIEHAGIVNRLRWMQAEYGLTAADVVLQKTPFSFDVSVWEFFWPLLSGSCLCVAPVGVHRDPDALAELIAAEGITTLHFVPSMLEPFVRGEKVRDCTTLRRVICSGEALPYDLTERFFERLERL